MTQQFFDRQDFIAEGDDIKLDAQRSIYVTRGVTLSDEFFAQLVAQSFEVYGYVVRAQILEMVSHYLKEGELTEANIDKTIHFLAGKLDGAAARLGNTVELVEECRTPGPRH
jgi:hypothetical protein